MGSDKVGLSRLNSSSRSTGRCCVVYNVLNRMTDDTRFHFDSIAHDNSALSSTILTSTPPAPLSSHPRPSHPQSQSQSHSQLQSTPASSATSPNLHLITPSPVILTGLQHVHKFSHNPSGAPRPGHESDTPDTVWIGVALWRVWTDPPDTTAPNTGAPSESGPSGAAPSGGGSGRGGKKADVVCSINVNLSSEDGQGSIERGVVERWWSRSVQSLVIRDWDLFGDAE